jgi:hypothetical protein
VLSEFLLDGETSNATSWLLSAGGHIGFGMVLFLSVKKFFEDVEKPLNETTKREIAAWVLGVKPSESIRDWRSTFVNMFNKVFGERHWSWKCFWRSCLFTVTVTLVVMLEAALFAGSSRGSFSPVLRRPSGFALAFAFTILASFLSDYLSLWKTRFLMNVGRTERSIVLNFVFLAIDILLTLLLAWCAAFVGSILLVYVFLLLGDDVFVLMYVYGFLHENLTNFKHLKLEPALFAVWFIPAFVGRLWFIAYVTSGLLLKYAKSLDFGFTWFNRRFDVQKQPLHSIGLVAGTLLAVGYWLLVIVRLLP